MTKPLGEGVLAWYHPGWSRTQKGQLEPWELVLWIAQHFFPSFGGHPRLAFQ